MFTLAGRCVRGVVAQQRFFVQKGKKYQNVEQKKRYRTVRKTAFRINLPDVPFSHIRSPSYRPSARNELKIIFIPGFVIMALTYGPVQEHVFRSSANNSPKRFSAATRPLLYKQWTPGRMNTTATRPLLYKQWTPGRMNSALKAVIEEHESVCTAAQKFNVPKNTLGDRVSGRGLPRATSGPDIYLSMKEEEELVWFLCRSPAIGHGCTQQEVCAIVGRVLASRGSNKEVFSGWWASFVSRHPEIVLCTPATLSLSHAVASDRCALDSYYDELESTLVENGLSENPCLIFKMDETEIPLDSFKPKIVTFRGHKNPVQVSGGEKSQVTVVGCVSTSGQCLPPMVIWDKKALLPELAVKEVRGTIYGLSEKGWMDQELFDMWFHKHFFEICSSCKTITLVHG